MLSLSTLLLWAAVAVAQEADSEPLCPSLIPPPDRLQVAWITPVRKRVWGRTSLAVVRVAELRTFVQAQRADQARTLQALGIIGARGRVHKRYKVTLFDVSADQLCRPVEHTPEGEDSDGLPACAQGRQVGMRHTTGCGTTTDMATGAAGFQLYQLPWREAARAGFCVMPLERFLDGA